MTKYALVLCATLWLLGVGDVATAQGTAVAPGSGTVGALGNAQAVDETALALGAQGTAQAQPGASTAGTSTVAYFLRMILVLALVIGAIWVVFRFMKRAQGPAVEDNSALRVLASASLGQGKAVHVVGLGGKAWLLGAAESTVSLIAEIEDREVIDELELKAVTAAGRPKADFRSLLGGLLGRGARSGAKGKSGGGPLSFGSEYLSQQRERLKKYQGPQP